MEEKRIISQEELDRICLLHNRWIEDEEGKCAVFENCTFDRLSFAGMQLNRAVFRNCDFKQCDLADAAMCFAEMNNVEFNVCDCHMLVAEEAVMRNVRFTTCNMKSAVFTHSSFRNVQFDNCDQNGMSLQSCYELPEADIIRIKPEELRRMNGKEGLILQGCGGDIQEWADGINSALTDTEILKNGSMFSKIYVFEHEGHTCIMFPFEGAELDIYKLAMWRLQTHAQFYGKWLSDYVPNRLGGFITEKSAQEHTKPECPIIGEDSNIFHIMGIASKALRRNGMADEAKEMCERITSSDSYNEALAIIMEYVEPVAQDGSEDPEIEMQ